MQFYTHDRDFLGPFSVFSQHPDDKTTIKHGYVAIDSVTSEK